MPGKNRNEQTVTIFGTTFATKTFLTIFGLLSFAAVVLYAGIRLGSKDSISTLKSKASETACTKTFTVVARPTLLPTPTSVSISNTNASKTLGITDSHLKCANTCTLPADCKIPSDSCVGASLAVGKAVDIVMARSLLTSQTGEKKITSGQPFEIGNPIRNIQEGQVLYKIVSADSFGANTASTKMRVYLNKTSPMAQHSLLSQSILAKEFIVTPGKVMDIVLTLPECGAYEVSFGSDLTEISNKSTDVFWTDNPIIPCDNPTGCCAAQKG
jgi:hypothetical protein